MTCIDPCGRSAYVMRYRDSGRSPFRHPLSHGDPTAGGSTVLLTRELARVHARMIRISELARVRARMSGTAVRRVDGPTSPLNVCRHGEQTQRERGEKRTCDP